MHELNGWLSRENGIGIFRTSSSLKMRLDKEIYKNFKGIIDTTLREGLQFARANFGFEEHLKIFNYLLKIGVDYVELSNPVKDEIKEIVRELVRSKGNSRTKILAHIRNNPKDLERAIESGIDGVNILCTADPERISSLNLSHEDYLKILEKNIVTAKNLKLEVRISTEDIFRQPFDLVLKTCELARSLKVDRIGVPDTLGIAFPWIVYERIKELRSLFETDIEVHFHNDFGHSVSNSISALKAGANWVDTTLLGIGERTGITPLSTFLINLYNISPELTEKYKMEHLTEAENYVAKVCNVEVPINLMTNLTNGFAHKAGIHLNAIINFGPHKYEPIPPKIIGGKRNLIIKSMVSGKTSEDDILEFFKKYGDS
ncbi:MAG: LeuA family protein [Candidatus Aminicenantia bacterium]